MEVVSATPGTRRMMEPMIILSKLSPSPTVNSSTAQTATTALDARLMMNLEAVRLSMAFRNTCKTKPQMNAAAASNTVPPNR